MNHLSCLAPFFTAIRRLCLHGLLFSLFSCQVFALSGDVAPLGKPDGQITVADALITLRMALDLTAIELSADVGVQDIPDGRVGVSDALLILRSALGLITLVSDGSRYVPALGTFDSLNDMAEYLKLGLRQAAIDNTLMDNIVYMATDSSASPESMARTVSTTNVQEQGVDEADLMKTDGQYLYVAASSHEACCWISPINESVALLNPPTDTATPTVAETSPVALDSSLIKVYALDTNPPQARYVSNILLTENDRSVNNLYLVTNREAGLPNLLAVVSGQSNNIWGNWGNFWYWANGKTELHLFDITQPEAASSLTTLTLDGQLIASRRIGEIVYLVTRFTPNPANFNRYPYDEEAIAANDRALDAMSLDDLLPNLYVNSTLSGKLVQADNCLVPPRRHKSTAESTLIVVTAVDLTNPTQPVTTCLAGSTETVYVAQGALYLATTRQDYRVNDGAFFVGSPPQITDLHKFGLTPAGAVYQGSGSVVGYLGWETDKRPFRMSHHNGILRIATSLGQSWNQTARTRLTLLEEASTITGVPALRQTAQLNNIGEPGERLYAVRYQGDRAYMVTFRVTDPLYVLDLSDPYYPVITGELKIEGYSDYLHPMSNDLLLGIGKDAVADERGDFGGRGAWYQGVKLALFDVSDVSHPVEVDSLVLGKRGTQSALLSDHRALAWLPARDGIPARLALPIQLHDTASNSLGDNPVLPSQWYDWTQTGLYLFDVGVGAKDTGGIGIQPRGQMIVERPSPDQTEYYPARSTTDDRALLVDDAVYYIHQRQVWSANWNDDASLIGPE